MRMVQQLIINGSDLGRRRGGNESYLVGLLAGLAVVAEESGIQVNLVVASEGARLLEAEPAWHNFGVIDVGPYRRLPFHLWQQTAAIRAVQADWMLSTFFLPPIVPCRAAVLIHDLSFQAHPEYFPRSIAAYMRVLTGMAIRRADVVVALSEFTRQEVVRFYPAAEDRTFVVYPGVSGEFQPGSTLAADSTVLARLGVQRPYLLAVGNIHPRKNLHRLLAAWEQLRNAGQPVPRMVWAGLGRWDSSNLIEQAESAGVLFLGFVAPADLPALYRQAEALAYPSLYEGFGLPPVEAMACGTPTLTDISTSLPEAVGDAAVLVDASETDALASGLSRVLFDPGLRRSLRTRGLAHAAQFRWERTARQLLQTLVANSA